MKKFCAFLLTVFVSMNIFAQVAVQSGAASSDSSALMTFIPIVLVGLIVYFVIRRKKSAKTNNQIEKDEVQSSESESQVCEKCGNLIPIGVKFCPNCGKKVSSKKKLSRNQKIKIGVGIAAFIIVGNIITNNPSIQQKRREKEQQRIEEEKLAKKEANRKSAIQKFGVSEEEYAEIEKKFSQCGISGIENVIDSWKIEDETCFKLKAEEIPDDNVIVAYLSSKNQLTEIVVNGKSVYKNGKVLARADENLAPTSDDESQAKYLCEKHVKEELFSPSSAKFCGWANYQFSYDTSKHLLLAKGYVDSQNAFGAMVRTNYSLYYDYKNKRPVSMNIGGNEYTFSSGKYNPNLEK